MRRELPPILGGALEIKVQLLPLSLGAAELVAKDGVYVAIKAEAIPVRVLDVRDV